jgi:hypothetical protein
MLSDLQKELQQAETGMHIMHDALNDTQLELIAARLVIKNIYLAETFEEAKSIAENYILIEDNANSEILKDEEE